MDISLPSVHRGGSQELCTSGLKYDYQRKTKDERGLQSNNNVTWCLLDSVDVADQEVCTPSTTVHWRQHFST